MNRRQFLASSLASSIALPAGLRAASRGADPNAFPFRISLAQWSLHRAHYGTTQPQLPPIEFPATAKAFGIDGVDYVNTFYRDKLSDDAYWRDLKRRCDGLGVRSLLIMCDGEGDLGAPETLRREEAVANHMRWVDRAALLGCHSIRVNAGSAGTREEQRDRVADGLRRLCEAAAPARISVIVENHGGWSSHGAWLRSVIEQVDHPGCGTLPDFGNFTIAKGQVYDRYLGTRELMPFAKSVSAKSYDFDNDGNETTIDYARMLRIVVENGYDGWVGIEYEGGRLSEPDGIRATLRLLRRVGKQIAEERAK